MSLNKLLNEIEEIKSNIQSERVTHRTQALNRLSEILDTRIDELRSVQDDDMDWRSLFDCACAGLSKVCKLYNLNI